MFSEATYPQSEQIVSPLISSESQDDPPQTSHFPDTDSVLRDLDGLATVLMVLFLTPGEELTTLFLDVVSARFI